MAFQARLSKKTPFTFEPPSGGDLVLRSSDGVMLHVHSVLLGLASTFFSDMLSIGTKSTDIIDVGDDSETLSLMLAFIYPSAIPTIDTFELLEKGLQIAQKYQVESMLKILDQTLSQGFNNSLIRDSPLRMFYLSSSHGLRASQTASAQRIMSSHCDLRSPQEIVKLAEQNPSAAHLIGLVGAQGARAKILFDVLFDLSDFGLLPSLSPDEYEAGANIMMCSDCMKSAGISITEDWNHPNNYTPSWLHEWARHAFYALSQSPLADCNGLFEPSILRIFSDQSGACDRCIDIACQAGATIPVSAFTEWASGVRRYLDRELQALDCLYEL
jgi:hypothetical protein